MACHLTYAWVVGGGLGQEALQRQLEAATTATNKQASIAAVAEETAARTKEDLTAARIETQAVQSMLTGKTCVADRLACCVRSGWWPCVVAVQVVDICMPSLRARPLRSGWSWRRRWHWWTS